MNASRLVFGGHSPTRTGPPTYRNAHKNPRTLTYSYARKEESDKFNLDVFFFLPGRIALLYLLPIPPFFWTARRDHQSASCGLFRGYATRLQRSLRVPGEVSLIRLHQGSLFRSLLPSHPDNFHDSSALSMYHGIARHSADTSALMKPRLFDE